MRELRSILINLGVIWSLVLLPRIIEIPAISVGGGEGGKGGKVGPWIDNSNRGTP